MREKFDLTVEDHLTGLQIFAYQKNMDDFIDLFTRILSEKDGLTLTQRAFEDIGRNLMLFDSDKEKQKRLELAEKL